MIKALLIVLFAAFFFMSCKDEPTPPEEKPEGYQEDIPWPSLAESAWPMFQGNPQGTNRSKYLGPASGTIEWSSNIFSLTTGFSLGVNWDLYAASSSPPGIYKLDINNGKLIWQFDSLFQKSIDVHPCPIILSNGTIIATNGNNGQLIALSPDGKLKWNYSAGYEIYNRGITISKDYLILFIDHSSTLHAVDTSGHLRWKTYDPRFGYFGHETPVFSPDGKVIYMQGVNVGLVAFDLQKREVLWTFGKETCLNYPLVDTQGHVYFLSPYTDLNKTPSLVSLNPDGSTRWIFEHNSKNIGEVITSLTMNKYGDIYFSGGNELFCVNYLGQLKFKKNFGTPVPIIVDSNNDLYLLLWENKTAAKLNRDAEFIWKLENVFNDSPGYSVISKYGQWIISDYQYSNNLISIK